MSRFFLASLSLALASATACASTPAPAEQVTAPEARCVRHSIGGPARQLGISDPSRSEFNPLSPGSYRIEVEADSYRAACQFELPDDDHLADMDLIGGNPCSGDQVGLMSNSENVVGILVPARLPAMRVRVLRNRVPVFDGPVSASSPCPRSGLCISMQRPGDTESESEGLEQAE